MLSLQSAAYPLSPRMTVLSSIFLLEAMLTVEESYRGGRKSLLSKRLVSRCVKMGAAHNIISTHAYGTNVVTVSALAAGACCMPLVRNLSCT